MKAFLPLLHLFFHLAFSTPNINDDDDDCLVMTLKSLNWKNIAFCTCKGHRHRMERVKVFSKNNINVVMATNVSHLLNPVERWDIVIDCDDLSEFNPYRQ